MIFYTNRFILERFAACTRGPFVFIRPKYKDDIGLLEHEKVHRWQWVRTLGFHSLLYLLVQKYRLMSEVEAYKEQLKYYTVDKSDLFATYLCEKYGLTITKQAALRLLRE